MKRLSVVVAMALGVAALVAPASANAASVYSLQVSKSADRSAATVLDGSTQNGIVYVFTTPASGVKQVRFYLDNTAATGTPKQTENTAPYDLLGTATAGTANAFNINSLPNGTHTVTAALDKTAGGTDIVTATFTVTTLVPPPSPYSLQVSKSADRSAPSALEGSTQSGTIYVFTAPISGVKQVRFFIDNPAATGTPKQTEGNAPYDLAGTATSGNANAFTVNSLPDGTHTVTAAVDKTLGGTDVVTATFTVGPAAPPPAALALGTSPLALTGVPAGTPVTGTLSLTSTGSTAPAWTATANQPWLAVTPGAGTGPATLTVQADPAALAVGSYTGTVNVTAPGFTAASASVTFAVISSTTCTPVACSQIKVQRPYSLSFANDVGGILDKGGVGTGFTTYLRTGAGGGYLPANLTIDPSGKGLLVATTPGGVNTTENKQDNLLGVGFDGTASTVVETTLPTLPAGTGKFEQAGAWFGYSQDEIERIGVVSVAGGWQFEHTLESGGLQVSKTSSAVIAIGTSSPVTMRITTNPANLTSSASYRVGASGAFTALGTVTIPGAFFSFDAAGINPEIATRSFAGDWATSRQATVRPTFDFSAFSLVAGSTTPPPPSQFAFDKVRFPVSFPTAMVTGPDGKLYVATLGGTIHRLTLGADGSVTNDQAITTLGARLALGITIDPSSSAGNVIVWVSHSSPAVLAGIANTGTVTRLSGPNLATRSDVITGLPRSISNHSVNGLHFGSDGRLYIAVGGNTGGGSPNLANTEFGPLAEQPLSAAIVVADVNKVHSATFDGSCDNTVGTNIYGPNPCDVTTWATGLRNTYDFVFHSNGLMYGPDNGLGVVGSYPPRPTAPCFGFGDTTSWTTGGDNPGTQPDKLNLIEQGKYYGHPNPDRNECVFMDGHYQKVPAPDYTPPLLNLGNDHSADGIVEYRGPAFCGALDKNLLLANYSTGKDITRVVLSANGRSVVSKTSLMGGFLDPLPITETPQGWIVVGETGGAGSVTILKPHETGCYATDTALPTSLLDAGGTAIGSTMYVVAGKNATSHVNSLYGFNSTSHTWSTLAPKPGTPVENPSVSSYNGKLYVVGGSTGPFSGAVDEGWVYDPGTDSWAALPALATARGGAGSTVVGSTMYVVGGMDGGGASLTSVEKLDLSNPTAWTAGPDLSTPRDNPGVVSVGTTVFAFGGRTRLADGTTVVATLSTVEALTNGASSWVARASMPTGRRTMAAVVVNGKAYLAGGEITAMSGAFAQNEQYDPATNTWAAMIPLPTPRHGMAAGVISGRIYLIEGGTTGGTSFSNVNEVFTPPA